MSGINSIVGLNKVDLDYRPEIKNPTDKKDTGKTLSASSSFRSYEKQQYFYNCYITKSCNGGNLAAKPGTSKHEGGLAIDFNVPSGSTSVPKVTSCASTSGFSSVTDKKSPNRWH